MARWTDVAQWRGPTTNQGPAMGEQRGMVLHIAAGYYEGTISWQKNPNSRVSSHFVVAGPRDARWGVPDGKIAQVVDTDIAAWTQRDGNGEWMSIEFSGFVGDSLSPAQVESAALLFSRGHLVYGYPLQLATSPSGRGLGHHSMGAESGANWGHSECPGSPIKNQKPAILARAIEIAGGDMALTQADLDAIGRRVWSWDTGSPGGVQEAWAMLESTNAAARAANTKLDQPPPVTVDAAALAAALIADPNFIPAIAAALRPVIDEELDEQARGGADPD